jgi:hypothetical protein
MAVRRDVISITLRQDNEADFLNQIRYFSLKQLLKCPREAGWTPF